MSDLILLKAWIFITPRWLNVCLCLSCVCQNSKGGFPAVSSSQLAGILHPDKDLWLFSSHHPLSPSTHLSASICLPLFFFSASGPQQDDCFNINHSHTPCQTNESARQSKKDKRARYGRWILNNSFLSQTTTAPLFTGLCAFTPHLLILTQTSQFHLILIHKLAIWFSSNLDLALIHLDISGTVYVSFSLN